MRNYKSKVVKRPSHKIFTVKDTKKSSINLPCARFKCRECGKLVYGEVMNFLNVESQGLWLEGNHEGSLAGPLCESCNKAKKYVYTEIVF